MTEKHVFGGDYHEIREKIRSTLTAITDDRSGESRGCHERDFRLRMIQKAHHRGNQIARGDDMATYCEGVEVALSLNHEPDVLPSMGH